jgi:hypothetical protein
MVGLGWNTPPMDAATPGLFGMRAPAGVGRPSNFPRRSGYGGPADP